MVENENVDQILRQLKGYYFGGDLNEDDLEVDGWKRSTDIDVEFTQKIKGKPLFTYKIRMLSLNGRDLEITLSKNESKLGPVLNRNNSERYRFVLGLNGKITASTWSTKTHKEPHGFSEVELEEVLSEFMSALTTVLQIAEENPHGVVKQS